MKWLSQWGWLTSPSPHIITSFFDVVITFKIYCLNNFQVYSPVLLIIVTVLFIRSPELIHLKAGNVYFLTNMSLFPYSLVPAAIILYYFYEFSFLKFHI